MNKWGAPMQSMWIEENMFYEREIRCRNNKKAKRKKILFFSCSLRYESHLSSEAVPCQEATSEHVHPYYEV